MGPAVCFSLEAGALRMNYRSSLVVPWLRIYLPMQGTQVWSLAWEDPACLRAIKPMGHNWWAECHNCRSPHALEPVLHNRRCLRSDKHTCCNQRVAPYRPNQRNPESSNRESAQPNIQINEWMNFSKEWITVGPSVFRLCINNSTHHELILCWLSLQMKAPPMAEGRSTTHFMPYCVKSL